MILNCTLSRQDNEAIKSLKRMMSMTQHNFKNAKAFCPLSNIPSVPLCVCLSAALTLIVMWTYVGSLAVVSDYLCTGWCGKGG